MIYRRGYPGAKGWFPKEFSEVLHTTKRREIASMRNTKEWFSPHVIYLACDLLQPEWTRRMLSLLERYVTVTYISQKLPPKPQSFSKAFSETLHPIGRFRSALPTGRALHTRTLRQLGVWRMLRSRSLREFVEGVAGEPLVQNGCQVISYEEGDYQGPHLDVYPPKRGKRYYFDFQLTLCNARCRAQELLYQERTQRHCNARIDVTRSGTVLIHRLPYWHQVTPLVGHRARRWVLIATFDPKA